MNIFDEIDSLKYAVKRKKEEINILADKRDEKLKKLKNEYDICISAVNSNKKQLESTLIDIYKLISKYSYFNYNDIYNILLKIINEDDINKETLEFYSNEEFVRDEKIMFYDEENLRVIDFDNYIYDFIDYVIDYKLSNNKLDLEKDELKLLLDKYINKDKKKLVKAKKENN